MLGEVDLSHTPSTERPLNDVQQPVVRQGPLWIAEPPLNTGEQMSVNDPNSPFAIFCPTGRCTL